MKKVILICSLFLISSLSGFFAFYQFFPKKIISPEANIAPTPTEKPLAKYSFEALKKRIFPGSEIIFDKVIKDDLNFTSYLFFFTSEGKRVSGMASLPKKSGTYPVIIQFRGYIDRIIYETGAGTAHSGEVFASNGFITLSDRKSVV